jgi:hypothetical protein
VGVGDGGVNTPLVDEVLVIVQRTAEARMAFCFGIRAVLWARRCLSCFLRGTDSAVQQV